MTVLDEVAETLEARVVVLREELELAESALRILRGSSTPEPRPTTIVINSSPSSEGKKSNKAQPKTSGPGTRRKFSDEEKADSVDRALEIGSWSSAADELGIHQSVLRKWQREGFGGSGGGV